MTIRTKFNPLGVGSKYNMNEVVISGITSGSGTITLPAGVYNIVIVGAGGGAATANAAGAWHYGKGGGGGSAFDGELYIPTSGIYSYFIGSGGGGAFTFNTSSAGSGGDTYLKNSTETVVINAGGGAGGYAWVNGAFTNSGGVSGGGGGILTLTGISNWTNNVGRSGDYKGNGDTGGNIAGINSVAQWSGNAAGWSGYGLGGQAYTLSGGAGGNGYLKLTYLRKYW